MTDFRKNKKDQDFRNNFFMTLGVIVMVISMFV